MPYNRELVGLDEMEAFGEGCPESGYEKHGLQDAGPICSRLL